MISEGAQKSLAFIGYAIDDSNHSVGVFATGCLDQTGVGHQFYFADKVRAPDPEKAIGLLIGSRQQRMDQSQIHDPPAAMAAASLYESCRRPFIDV